MMTEYDQRNSGALPIVDEAALAANEDRYSRMREQFSTNEVPQPAFVPNMTVVDAVSLAKAQGRFINEQTKFLLVPQDQDYQLALTAYSRAQTAYIAALQQALHQADVI